MFDEDKPDHVEIEREEERVIKKWKKTLVVLWPLESHSRVIHECLSLSSLASDLEKTLDIIERTTSLENHSRTRTRKKKRKINPRRSTAMSILMMVEMVFNRFTPRS